MDEEGIEYRTKNIEYRMTKCINGFGFQVSYHGEWTRNWKNKLLRDGPLKGTRGVRGESKSSNRGLI